MMASSDRTRAETATGGKNGKNDAFRGAPSILLSRLPSRDLARLLLPFRIRCRKTDGEHAMSTTTATAAPAAPKPLYASLFVQVLAALLLGIVLGMAAPDFAVGLKILSDAFLKLK
jgi:predicted secreted protein